ncbi:MAG: hypothetical protein FJZ96_08640 [Chloroflexi bacterium]|nr:hypothetical protein [Chloroflexota bacterium]
MKNRTTAIILTVVSVLLCGCPGIGLCIFGALAVSGTPFTTTINGYSTTQPLPIAYGIGGLCAAVIMVAIPIVVGVVTLRKKKETVEAGVATPDEPLPPAS